MSEHRAQILSCYLLAIFISIGSQNQPSQKTGVDTEHDLDHTRRSLKSTPTVRTLTNLLIIELDLMTAYSEGIECE